MKRALSHRGVPAAFTLIEVMIAVMIVMLLSISLAQFLRVNLDAIGSMTEAGVEQERMGALLRYVQGELNNLPPNGKGGAGVLVGTANKFRDLSSDEIQWLCKPGSGVLTSAAVGQFRTTLMLRPQSQTSRVFDLGLRRRPVEGTDKEVNWLPLMTDVAAMEIRYLQLGAWVDRWNNQGARPSLVRFRIWKTKGAAPVEAVMAIDASRVNG